MTMQEWINHPLTLTGKVVELISFDNSHYAALAAIARDKRIWEFYAYDASDPEKFKSIFQAAMKDMEKGIQSPFVIFHKEHKRVVGSTRLMDIQRNHKKLEIGTT